MHFKLFNHAGKRKETKIEQTGQPPWHILIAMDEQWTEYFQLDRSVISALCDVLAKSQTQVSCFSTPLRQSTIWETGFHRKIDLKVSIQILQKNKIKCKKKKFNQSLPDRVVITHSLSSFPSWHELRTQNSPLNSFDSLAYCLHFLYPTERYTMKLSEAWVFLFPNHSFCQFFSYSLVLLQASDTRKPKKKW